MDQGQAVLSKIFLAPNSFICFWGLQDCLLGQSRGLVILLRLGRFLLNIHFCWPEIKSFVKPMKISKGEVRKSSEKWNSMCLGSWIQLLCLQPSKLPMLFWSLSHVSGMSPPIFLLHLYARILSSKLNFSFWKPIPFFQRRICFLCLDLRNCYTPSWNFCFYSLEFRTNSRYLNLDGNLTHQIFSLLPCPACLPLD